jgi:uncharacterized protein with HEPN domain
MPPEIDAADQTRLRHMLEAARDALQFSVGRSREDLDSDVMYRRAIVHCIQEIGEAAVRVTQPTRAIAPELPWNQIVGMRHRLVHVYFAINLDLVWEVIAMDLPPLVDALARVLNPEKKQ